MRILKRNLAFVLAMVMALSLTVSAANVTDYTDADDVTFVEAVDVMTALGILEGTDGEFNPTDILTREQAAKIIAYMMLGKTAAENLTKQVSPFNDVVAGRWSAGYVAYCASQGIIGGYGNGNFGPEDELTATQFAKMLLCACGYGVNGEYTGANWEINVNKDALKLGVFDGNLDAQVSAPCTREEAALYAFNTLKDVKTVSYSELFGSYYSGELLDEEDGHTLGTELYKLTEVTANVEDNFGRKAHYWKSGVKVLTDEYANVADVTYTDTVKLETIYADLGLTKAATVNASFTVNGRDMDSVALPKTDSTDAKLDYSGKGVLVEVYVDENEVVDIVLISTFLAKVSEYDAEDEIVTVQFLSADAGDILTDDVDFKTAVAYEKNDYVLVQAALVDGKYAIQSVEAAEMVEGALTAKSTSYVKFDGEKVNKSMYAAPTMFAAKFDDEVQMIVDNYGYVMGLHVVDAAEETTGYVLVKGSEGQTATLLTKNAAVVEVQYLDGSETEVLPLETKKINGELYFHMLTKAVETNDNWIKVTNGKLSMGNTFYAYYMTENNEIVLKELSLTDANEFAAVVNGEAVNNCAVKFDGTTTAVIGGTNYRVNAKTVVTVIDADNKVTTYNGYKNTKFDMAGAYVMGIADGSTNLIKELYVIGEATTESDNIFAYFTNTDASKEIVDGGIQVALYIDGKTEFYVVDGTKNATATSELNKAAGLYVITIDEDNEITMTLASTLDASDDTFALVSGNVTKTATNYFNVGDTTCIYGAEYNVYNVEDGIKTATVAQNNTVTVVMDKNAEVVLVLITDKDCTK